MLKKKTLLEIVTDILKWNCSYYQ